MGCKSLNKRLLKLTYLLNNLFIPKYSPDDYLPNQVHEEAENIILIPPPKKKYFAPDQIQSLH